MLLILLILVVWTLVMVCVLHFT